MGLTVARRCARARFGVPRRWRATSGIWFSKAAFSEAESNSKPAMNELAVPRRSF